MNRSLVIAIVLFVILVMFMRGESGFYNQTLIYGSPSCGWCKKQVAYMDAKGLPYHFVDCGTNACPSFVDSFPTLVVNNKIVHGYTEI
jgi:glutaredoxin